MSSLGIVGGVTVCFTIAVLLWIATRLLLDGRSKTTLYVADNLDIPEDSPYVFVVRTGEVLKVTEVDYEKKTITVEKVEG